MTKGSNLSVGETKIEKPAHLLDWGSRASKKKQRPRCKKEKKQGEKVKKQTIGGY